MHRSLWTVEVSLKPVNLCKFTAWFLDVLADKPHPRFDTEILSEKVQLIRRCLRYFTPLFAHLVKNSFYHFYHILEIIRKNL